MEWCLQTNQTSGWNYDIADMEHWQYTVYEHNLIERKVTSTLGIQILELMFIQVDN